MMLVVFTCKRCGEKFMHKPRTNGGSEARFCAACRRERKKASNKKLNEERKRQRAEAKKSAKVVRWRTYRKAVKAAACCPHPAPLSSDEELADTITRQNEMEA